MYHGVLHGVLVLCFAVSLFCCFGVLVFRCLVMSGQRSQFTGHRFTNANIRPINFWLGLIRPKVSVNDYYV